MAHTVLFLDIVVQTQQDYGSVTEVLPKALHVIATDSSFQSLHVRQAPFKMVSDMANEIGPRRQ
jgi:hypothetical protein